MKGVVLQTYGEGNGPTARLDLMNTLREATTKGGVIIVNTSQCPRGSVSSAYAVGKVSDGACFAYCVERSYVSK